MNDLDLNRVAIETAQQDGANDAADYAQAFTDRINAASQAVNDRIYQQASEQGTSTRARDQHAGRRRMSEEYEEIAKHSSVLDRLAHATEQVQSEQQADVFGYHPDSGDYQNVYTPAEQEGDLDTLGPAGLGSEQLIRNGGSYGHAGDEQ